MKSLGVAKLDTLNNRLILSHGTTILLVDRQNCLYVKCYKTASNEPGSTNHVTPLQVKPLKKTIDAAMSDTMKGHLRFGHCSNKYLKFAMANAGLNYGDCQDYSCKVCSTAKSTRPQFASLGTQVASRCGELVFCDFWGPFRKPGKVNLKFICFALWTIIRAFLLFIAANPKRSFWHCLCNMFNLPLPVDIQSQK